MYQKRVTSNAALRRRDHLLAVLTSLPPASIRSRSALPPASACFALLLRPEAIVREVLHDAVLDPHVVFAGGSPSPRERQRRSVGIERIANAASRARRRPSCRSCFRRPASRRSCVLRRRCARSSANANELHEIADGRRLEHHGVSPRLDRRPDSPTRAPSRSRARRAPSGSMLATNRCASRRPIPSRCRRACARSSSAPTPVCATVREQSLVVRDRVRRACDSM